LDCVILASESDRNWGTFVMDNTIIPVLGLRHPMLANAEKMRAAVQEFLKSS